MENLKASTLVPFKLEHALTGFVLVSDEKDENQRLRKYGFNHSTVYHKLKLVDPETTVSISRPLKGPGRMRRSACPFFESHLDKIVWRKMHDGIKHPAKMFECFRRSVRKVFG